jgi:hypothetical protein
MKYWVKESPLVPACWTADGLAKKNVLNCQRAGEAHRTKLRLAKAKAQDAVKRELNIQAAEAEVETQRQQVKAMAAEVKTKERLAKLDAALSKLALPTVSALKATYGAALVATEKYLEPYMCVLCGWRTRSLLHAFDLRSMAHLVLHGHAGECACRHCTQKPRLFDA